MATSSGTEVGVEVEEEVEYVEEIVEYEEEEVEEETEEEEDDGKEQQVPVSIEAKVPSEEQPSAPGNDSNTEHEHSTIPPSTSARELPIQTTDASQLPLSAQEPGTVNAAPPTEEDAPTKRSGGGAGVDLDFKQIEAQAAKVANQVSHLALDVSSKLTAGLRSAFGGVGASASSSSSDPSTSAPAVASTSSALSSLAGVGGAGASLTKLAGGLSSWWGSLDPAPQPVRDETAERVAASNKASSELQALFGLSEEENLVEHFKCKLLQTYACSHNPHTPAIQMAFQGTLYVTDRHTCFSVEERGRKVPFKVPHGQVVKATRQRPARKGDLSDVLKLELSNGQWLALKDFDSGSALDSALALVEHLMEGN